MISMNHLGLVSQDLTLDEYRDLAEFRYRIRCFQSITEERAGQMGVDTDSYLLLLVIQGLPEGVKPTVPGIADRLCMSAENVNRLIGLAVSRSEITRASSEEGGREDWVKLTRNGRELLRRMTLANRDELERAGPELVRALTAVLKQGRRRHGSV
jgi:DNA-binding MarR family transcriptional regulator